MTGTTWWFFLSRHSVTCGIYFGYCDCGRQGSA